MDPSVIVFDPPRVKPPVSVPDEAAGLYGAFTVEELRAELRGRGLPTSGNKTELTDRLVAADDTEEDDDGQE